ncbi:MAG: CARDB domain-containing protein [Chloroflexota bacterium]
MSSFRSIVRRALSRAHHLTVCLSQFGRAPLAFAIAASLLVSVLGPPAPVHADPPADPDARLQLIIHAFHINDDEALFGGNDFFWDAYLENTDGPPASIWSSALPFHASTGDNVDVNQLIPQHPSDITGAATIAAGLPVYDSHTYRLFIRLQYTTTIELVDHVIGTVDLPISKDNNWGIGTYTSGSNPGQDDANKFLVSWEIRRTPLPDLVVKSIYVQDATGTPSICGDIRNVGQQAAPPAELTLSTEGTVVERFRLPALDVGWSYPHCVKRSDLPAKKHNIVFSIDDLRELPEMEELNNVNFFTVEAAEPAAAPGAGPTSSGPSAAPSPQPKPSGGQAESGGARADLTVRAIRVNGQSPDGKNDCKVGKNVVSVVVKNAGKGDAATFAVRLSVDGNDMTATVDGLDAGQEREVRFDNVPLKMGAHTLTATADPEHTIDESKEDNNELKDTARCQG